ncbi:MAG: energy transducer TonB [Crocinitomicaceae bacterium]|nr:energy transducer TonB [Crocinitomicaceae bacterium]
METKKSNEANIEKLRFPITLTALLFAGSLVLASFTYGVGSERDTGNELAENFTDITFAIDASEPETPEPTEPPQVQTTPPPDQNIIIDSLTRDPEPDFGIVLTPPDINIGPDVIIAPPPVIEFPDVAATLDGLQRWIAENVQYPQTSIEMGEQGKVYVSFVVEVDGSVSGISIERGVSTDLDREAQRLVRTMPSWTAGEVAGLKVRTRCRLPINFTLN